jgi:hypothetical protein
MKLGLLEVTEVIARVAVPVFDTVTLSVTEEPLPTWPKFNGFGVAEKPAVPAEPVE